VSEAYTEVVTHSKIREVELPQGAGTMALITLHNGFDYNKPNTLGPQTLGLLDAALDEAFAVPGVVAVGLIGKPFIFAAGADLKGVTSVTEHAQARDIAELGHRVLGRLSTGPVPVFTFFNGLALGGGMEIGLNSTYRTASRAAAGLALPECAIGLLPGWGGNWLTPNLIGADKAVTVIVENPLNNSRMLKADQALALGVVDAVFDGADFLEQSLLWAAKVLRGDIVVERPEIDRSEQTWGAAVARARGLAATKGRGAYPNVDKAIELIEAARTTTREQGFAAEDQALADLIMSDTTRSNLYAFDLVQRRAKKPAGAPDKSLARPVTKVGVVGAGLMASQLALLFARQMKVPVVMTDLDQERVDKGVAYVHGEVDKLVGKGRMNTDTANRVKALVTGTTDKAHFSDAEFVIEAVFEKMEVKQQVFGELEGYVKPDCVLASNTSSLSVAEMAKDLQYPERVVGFHFFTPVALMPTLEIAPTDKTDEATLATAFAVGKGIKKNCVWSKDTTAFIVNRLLLRGLGEAIKTVDEGTPFQVADQGVLKVGFPMGAFIVLALSGLGVSLHTAESLAAAFPDRFGTSPGLEKLVEAGKTAIYQWDEQGNQSVDPEVAALWPQGDSPSTADEVAQRVKEALADEARRMLDEGVAQAPQDIDLALIGGAGLPLPNGGLLPMLDREGISEQVTGQRFLPLGVASVAR
jgi:3-hydroxyacyl-CoA dehydrogenase/enoyl-CoA hydratase/carnithine racemase